MFIIAYVTGDKCDWLHEQIGYSISGLIVLRIVWGFVGTKHARFKDFTYHPLMVFFYLKDSIAKKAKRYVGHNPAGGAMIIALIFTIAVVSISGHMMTLDMFWGEQWVEDVHKFSVNTTLLLIVFHIFGVIFSSLEHDENLVKSMFTGKKHRD